MVRIAIFILSGFCLFYTNASFAEDSLRNDAQSALDRATDFFRSISTKGGYVGIYSLDLQQRFGESTYEKATDSQIWVQPPGTPSVGQTFLRAWRATGDETYLQAARETGLALAWGQRSIGGWDHRVDLSHYEKGSTDVTRKEGRCTFDDDITQGTIRFLIDLDHELDEAWLTESIELALEFMQESQFDNGAWPQWYPLRGGYHDYYTFNDNAINDCIDVMLLAHETYGNEEYLNSALKGGDFLIASQGRRPQAGWAQQYDHDLKPAWARRFEPPGLCSLATSRNIRSLIELYLYTGDDKFLKPIPAAIEWLEASPIAENRWARLYEVGTNKPIYGDREDGKRIFYDYDAISERERTSYGWQGSYGIPSTIRYYEKVIDRGREEILRQRNKPQSESSQQREAERMESEVKRIIAALDEKGRWIDDKTITSRRFVQNASALAHYLKLTQQIVGQIGGHAVQTTFTHPVSCLHRAAGQACLPQPVGCVTEAPTSPLASALSPWTTITLTSNHFPLPSRPLIHCE